MVHKVCVLGDAAVDLLVDFPVTRQGVKVMLNEPTLLPGGSGANTAIALRRLGIPTLFIGKIGDDQYGHIVKEDFIKEKVGITQLTTDSTLSTICVFAFIDQDGERYLWEWPPEQKAYTTISLDEINLEMIREAGWLHLTGLLLSRESRGRETALNILAWAKKNGVICSLDLNLRISGNTISNNYRNILMNAISNCDYVLGSQKEFALLDGTNHWWKAAENIASNLSIAIVRNGEKGSALFSKNKNLFSSAFNVPVIDTVGAGDVYNAGFITAVLHGFDFDVALQWGNGVAAYTISKKGARSCPSLDELNHFIESSIRQQ